MPEDTKKSRATIIKLFGSTCFMGQSHGHDENEKRSSAGVEFD